MITPNPKTSGGAHWNYLAGWKFAKRKCGSETKAQMHIAVDDQSVRLANQYRDQGFKAGETLLLTPRKARMFVVWQV